VDGHLITSRRPDDLPAFCHAILDWIARHVEGDEPVRRHPR